MRKTKRITNRRRKTRKFRNRMNGGMLKQDMINFGRDIGFGTKTVYNGLLGLQPPVNPNPYVQPRNILGNYR